MHRRVSVSDQRMKWRWDDAWTCFQGNVWTYISLEIVYYVHHGTRQTTHIVRNTQPFIWFTFVLTVGVLQGRGFLSLLSISLTSKSNRQSVSSWPLNNLTFSKLQECCQGNQSQNEIPISLNFCWKKLNSVFRKIFCLMLSQCMKLF